MDYLNSRYMTYLDAYFHKFVNEGSYVYRVAGQPTAYSVIVKQGGAPTTRTQKEVLLKYDPQKRSYMPEPAELTVNPDDKVRWSTDAPPGSAKWWVLGEGGAFASGGLQKGDAFSHYFFEPGTYNYLVCNNSPGTVIALSHQLIKHEALRKRALNPTPIILGPDGTPDPPKVSIYTGETVAWAVVEEVASGFWLSTET